MRAKALHIICHSCFAFTCVGQNIILSLTLIIRRIRVADHRGPMETSLAPEALPEYYRESLAVVQT